MTNDIRLRPETNLATITECRSNHTGFGVGSDLGPDNARHRDLSCLFGASINAAERFARFIHPSSAQQGSIEEFPLSFGA